MPKQSITSCLLPFVGCLHIAEKDFLGSDRVWIATNPNQSQFLSYNNEARSSLEKVPELSYIASIDNNVINKFFADGGFPEISIDPLDPGSFAAGSILKLALEWLKEGTLRLIKGKNANELAHTGFRLEGDHISHFVSSLDSRPVTAIRCKNGDTVYITIPASPPTTQFELLLNAQGILENKEVEANLNGLVMPCVELDQFVDSQWIIGLNTLSGGHVWEISDAKQKTRIKINRKGAKVESAAVVTLRCLAAMIDVRPDHVVDEPFIFIVERPGVGVLATAYIEKEDWKDPGDDI